MNTVVVVYEVVPEETRIYRGVVDDDELEILKSNCGTYGNCHDEHDYDALDPILNKLEQFELNELWEGQRLDGWVFVTGHIA